MGVELGKKFWAIMIIVLVALIFILFEPIVTMFKKDPFVSTFVAGVIIVILSLVILLFKGKVKRDDDTKDMKTFLKVLSRKLNLPANRDTYSYTGPPKKHAIEEWYRKNVY